MKRAVGVVLVFLVLAASVVLAQAPPKAPKPGKEHKRLSYFIGTWTGGGEAKPSSFGPGGKFTYKEHNEWLPGGFFVVTHSEGSGPMGEEKGIAVMGYDRDKKVYTYHAFNSMGMFVSSEGTVKGKNWTWNSESKMGGKMVKSRFSMKEVSSTSYKYKFETSEDGKTWATVMEGTSNKTK